MKLKELELFSVIKQEDKKKLFSGTRAECITFIKGFDSGSPKYVDLRLMDPSGKEDKWH